jgi:GntR family transcriptional regulator / MocR family aminotransferase
MSKQTSSFEFAIAPKDPKLPAYKWLYAALRDEIVNGRLRPGARLPATRDLAKQYGLARGTVMNSFDQLKAEGYLEGAVGSGTYVSKVLPDELLEVVPQKTMKRQASQGAERRISDFAKRVSTLEILSHVPRTPSGRICRRWICSPPPCGRRSLLAGCAEFP